MAWPKGQSGNPSGRPLGFKGLAKVIREQTDDGKALVDFALQVFRGQPDSITKISPSLAMRWDALVWLADRGFGRAVTPIDLTVGDESPMKQLDLSGAPTEDLQEADRILQRLEASVRVIDIVPIEDTEET